MPQPHNNHMWGNWISYIRKKQINKIQYNIVIIQIHILYRIHSNNAAIPNINLTIIINEQTDLDVKITNKIPNLYAGNNTAYKLVASIYRVSTI